MEFSSTEHPISWFRDRYLDGNLDLRPPYQRKPVWADRQRCSLIETILMDLPVPELFIQMTTTAKGDTTYAIVDGQQRIRTVLQFVGAEIDPEQQEHNKFALDKLEAESPWRNRTFQDMSDNERIRFFGYKFSVRYLQTDSELEVRDMFRRLNRFLTPLKPQELRNATYTGPFVKLAVRLADDEYWAENRIVTSASIRRMGDIEFVSELLIGVKHGPQGGSQKIIDEYYEQYEDYDHQFPGQTRVNALYKRALETVQTILPDIKETRWSNKTDFYTLFVAVAALLRTSDSPRTRTKIKPLRQALDQFAEDVDTRLADEKAQVSLSAIKYVRAMEKGANDKARRATRHKELRGAIDQYFGPRK